MTRRMKHRKPKPGRVTRDEWLLLRAAIRDRQHDRCGKCGTDCNEQTGGEVHHVLMRSRGGRDELDNLVLLHPECHRWVHDHPARATDLGLLEPSSA